MVTFIKATVSAVLLLISLVTLTFQKVSLVWCLREATAELHNYERRISILLLYVVTPYLASLMHVLWNVPLLVRKASMCASSNIFPILLGMVLSLVEGTCVWLFIDNVAIALPPYMLLPLLNAVVTMSILQRQIMSKRRREEPTSSVSVILICLIHISLPTGSAVLLHLTHILNFRQCCILVVTLLLISTVWIPKLQRYCLCQHRPSLSRCHVLYACMKIVGVISSALLFYYFRPFVISVEDVAIINVDRQYNITMLYDELLLVSMNLNTWFPILLNNLCSLLAVLISFASLGLCSSVFGIYVPVILSTIAAVAVTTLYEAEFTLRPSISFLSFQNQLASLIVIGIIWMIPLFLLSEQRFDPNIAMIPYNQLFHSFGWSGVFFDQKLWLNYSFENISQDTPTYSRSKVYICTTMYRETSYEMERLLDSLQNISTSTILKEHKINPEAHIIMDNGCKNNELQEFAQQLLVSITKIVNPSNVRGAFISPYGMQFNWQLTGGMMLVVHFKDPTLVKPKKRWSQVMYLTYVLRYQKQAQLRKLNYEYETISTDEIISPEDSYSKYTGETNTAFTNDENDSFSRYPSVDTGIGQSDSDSSNNDENLDSPCNSDNDFSFEDTSIYIDDDHTYILATDADMQFDENAVVDVIELCNQDLRIGCTCGRTHPVGRKNGLIVWHQIFEYAKDFWMIKRAQNVIGSVMCCPGCFTLYRITALRQVIDKYSTPTMTPFTVHVKDTGEDRWIATLMMIQGWSLRYSPSANNTTFCPDTFSEFLKQRKRWVLSDVGNAILVVRHVITLVRNNQSFSLVYVLYLIQMYLSNAVAPGSAVVLITCGLDAAFGIPYLYTTPVIAIVIFLYALFCTRASGRLQVKVTIAMTLTLGPVFVAVVVCGSVVIGEEIAQDISSGTFVFQEYLILISFVVSLAFAALCHPKESWLLIYGLAYLVVFPTMHILLPIYSICNIVDQSWGTRDSNRADKKNLTCFRSLSKLRTKKDKPHDSENGETITVPDVIPMEKLDEGKRSEIEFWSNLRNTVIGLDVNVGLDKLSMDDRLRSQRNRSIVGLLLVNLVWVVLLSVFYLGVSWMPKLNVYGIIVGLLYGFTLVVQTVGMAVDVAGSVYRKLGERMFRGVVPIWVHERLD